MNRYLLILACFLAGCTARAQRPVTGNWYGLLDAGAVKLRVVFHISDEGGGLKATMDSPDQQVKDIAVTSVQRRGDSLLLYIGMASYRGALVSDSSIDGVFSQGGRTFPLLLHHTAQSERLRPQTPKPPFPYRSEAVSYSNADGSVRFGATITAPDDRQRHPALLLITGSGQQNRDEELMEHKPFAVIADYLSRRGYVVLRVDDRGIGQTTGRLDGVTTLDFAHDAEASLAYLKQRPEVDTQKTGLLGHSEGGMIATMLAASRKDIAFIVSMAGPGIANSQLLAAQNDLLLEKSGVRPAARQAYISLYMEILDAVRQEPDNNKLQTAIEIVVNRWQQRTKPELVSETTPIKDEATRKQFAAAFAAELSQPWYRYFIAYDPAPDIRRLSCKVLALNGSADIQVPAKADLDGWKAALVKSHSKSYQVKELPGLNHLFQQCSRCDIDEYGELAQTIAPVALETIAAWLDQQVR